jgi:hypothetical protein
MESIADFKRKIQERPEIHTAIYFLRDVQYYLHQVHERRIVSIILSNSFALKTYLPTKEEFVDSWCNWPKMYEFIPGEHGEVTMLFPGGKIVYTFLECSPVQVV